MDESYTATTQTIGDLLGGENPLEVPLYQRSYAWRPTEVREFWDDIVDFADSRPREKDRYFLGSIVLVRKKAKFDVLDGQQRLASASMLLAAVRDVLLAEADEWKDEGRTLQQDYIAGKVFGRGRTYRLKLSKQDRTYFQRKVQDPNGHNLAPDRRLQSQKRIDSAFSFLIASVQDYRGSNGDGLKGLLRLAEALLYNVSVVSCVSTSYDTAATVFETLNSRGIELSTADLLRTWLMGRARNDADRERIAASWTPIFAMSEHANADDFIRHFWISRHGDVKAQKLYREIRGTLLKTRTDPVTFSQTLEEAAGVYEDLVSAKARDGATKRALEAVRAIGAKALYPALLSYWQRTTERDTQARRRVAKALVSLYVRHILIGGRDNSELEQTVFSVATGFRRNKAIPPALKKLRKIMPDDSEFQKEFARASIAGSTAAGYVLRELEQARRPRKELRVATPDLVHVEHIYPQKPSAADRWEDHSDVINRIGNLTPLAAPINQGLRNSTFSKKKPEYKKSELVITRDLAKCRKWDRAAIDKRQTDLAKLAPKIWPLPK